MIFCLEDIISWRTLFYVTKTDLHVCLTFPLQIICVKYFSENKLMYDETGDAYLADMQPP